MDKKFVTLHKDNAEIFLKPGNFKNLYLGNLVLGNIDMSSSAITTDNNCVSMVDVAVVPYKGATVYFNLPANISCKMFHNTEVDLNDTIHRSTCCVAVDDNLGDGTKYTFKTISDGYEYDVNQYRVQFIKTDGSSINVREIEDLIDSGDINIIYESHDNGIIDDCQPIASSIAACMSKTFPETKSSQNKNIANYIGNIPTFVHLSDIHGDCIRYERALQFAKHYEVDGVIYSGDAICSVGHDGIGFVTRGAKKYNVKVMPCVGNHDAYEYTQQQFYKNCTEPLSNIFDYPKTGKPYFYVDLPCKIRVISLDYNFTNDTSYINIANYGREQKEWFVDTLKSTPAGYGVIVNTHFLYTKINKVGEGKFFDDVAGTNPTTTHVNTTGMLKIIDAFKNKRTESIQWQDFSGTDTVNADFTALPNGVEFICWCTGHTHTDHIGYIDGYDGTTNKKQINMSISCGTLASAPARTRNGKDRTQDQFNLIGIDRDKKIIKIVRIGASMNADFKNNDYMTISYE